MNMLASIKDTEIQVNVVLQYGGQREMDQHASPYHLPASCAPTSLRCWRERSPGTAA